MQWSDLLDFACGELELREVEFWDMTPIEYERRARGYHIRDQRNRHNVRRTIHAILSPHLKRGNRLSLEEIDELPYLDQHKNKERSEAERLHDLEVIQKLKKRA